MTVPTAPPAREPSWLDLLCGILCSCLGSEARTDQQQPQQPQSYAHQAAGNAYPAQFPPQYQSQPQYHNYQYPNQYPQNQYAQPQGYQQGHSVGASASVPHAPSSTPARALFFPGDISPLLALINSARGSLDIAIYNLTSDKIANPILAAQKRGVRVRIVTDSEQAEGDARGNDISRLESAGVSVVRCKGLVTKGQGGRPGIMHNKYLIVDGHTIATGSFNYTRIAMEGNNENLLILTDPTLAAQYAANFQHLLRDAGSPFPQGNWQPNHQSLFSHALFFPSEPAFQSLVNLVSSAHSSLDLAMFNLTDDTLTNALIALSQRGVRVRLIADRDQASGQGSDVKRLGGQIAVKMLGSGKREGPMMHHKFGVIDGRILFTGR